MLLLNHIKENKQQVIDSLKIKNFDSAGIIENIIDIDSERRTLQKQSDDLFVRIKQNLQRNWLSLPDWWNRKSQSSQKQNYWNKNCFQIY